MQKKDFIQGELIREVEKLHNIKGEKYSSTLAKVLGISQAAVNRRLRLETEFTLDDLYRISKHYGISIDGIINNDVTIVNLDYDPNFNERFNIENYLENILSVLRRIQSEGNAKVVLSITNAPFLSLFNFPNLLRVKLFFWMKSQMAYSEMIEKSLTDCKFSNKVNALIAEILRYYNKIQSIEIYDAVLLRGFVREVHFHYGSKQIVEQEALQIYSELLGLVEHLKKQAEVGAKFALERESEPVNNLEVYYNEVINPSAIFVYKTDLSKGLFSSQNLFIPIHIVDNLFVNAIERNLKNVIKTSSKISVSNSKTRNAFFDDLIQYINKYKVLVAENQII